jgi:hypothetical protein
MGRALGAAAGGDVGFLDDWNLSYDEINELLTDNPSLRSFVSGYAAEMKCRRMWFDSDSRASGVTKFDDHDRAKKGDIALTYRGEQISIEVKSLQTNSLRVRDGVRSANFQCDASDRRIVRFADGSEVNTTCLLVGEFDILAVNLFAFYGEWRFVFAHNRDLPRVRGNRGAAKNYTEYQRSNLLATLMPMSDPPVGPYRDEPWSLMDEIIEWRESGSSLALAAESSSGEEGHA